MSEFPKWTDENHSLIKKHLTREDWEALKDKTTSVAGFTLQKAVQTCIDNQDSGVGIYAGDLESYEVFSPVFDRIIEDYHGGYKKDAKHKTDLNAENLKGGHQSDVDPDGAVLSTRIRVGRNIVGYGLSPGITREQRKEVEKLVSEALTSMEGDLKGTYYPLSGMAEDVRLKLVEDHFLFKKGDRFLESCGANRDWPESRGIFHNDAKTFLVWINEEDQLRIISMQKGAEVKEVFARLTKAIAAIEASLAKAGKKFQYTDHLGYIHSCPTNLGTGLRASVHVAIPHVSARDDFKKICADLKLQPRGVHGEHSESSGGVFDISNKHRIGYSEVELVQVLIDGVKKLLELEKELAAKMSSFPQWEESNHSLIKKHLTPEIFDQLKGLKSSVTGYTLQKSIQTCVENQDSGIGIYAGDEECYKIYAPILDRIIEDYHGGYKPEDKHVSDMDASKLLNGVGEKIDPTGEYILSTRIRVGRNIVGFGLSPGITREQRKKVQSLVTTALAKLDGELSGSYYPLEGMQEDVRLKLVEDHFLFKKGDRFLEACGANRDWPESRGIFHNDAKTFLVWVNEEDQLRIISMQKGANVTEVFTRLSKAIAAIEASLKEDGFEYQFNDHHGYIHSCPTNIGTGLRGSVHVKIPNVGKLPDFKKICNDLGLQPRGVHGEHSETDSGIFDISNKARIGKSEVQLVQTMIDGVTKLIAMEKELAAKS